MRGRYFGIEYQIGISNRDKGCRRSPRGLDCVSADVRIRLVTSRNRSCACQGGPGDWRRGGGGHRPLTARRSQMWAMTSSAACEAVVPMLFCKQCTTNAEYSGNTNSSNSQLMGSLMGTRTRRPSLPSSCLRTFPLAALHHTIPLAPGSPVAVV